QVYGYLLARCGQGAVAEDLTGEPFLAAVDRVKAGPGAPVSTAWLVGVARHKLSDHWRRQAREQRALHAVAAEPGSPAGPDDPWDARLNALRARDVLQRLGPHHRAALTVRDMEDPPVPGGAGLLGRPRPAPEALPHRAGHRGAAGAGAVGVPRRVQPGGGGGWRWLTRSACCGRRSRPPTPIPRSPPGCGRAWSAPSISRKELPCLIPARSCSL